MIITEYFMTRKDGVVLNCTYSDKKVFIERDGFLYTEAVNIDGVNYEYKETNIPIIEPKEEQI